MDKLAQCYKTVRDATLLDNSIKVSEALAVLELVKFELLQDAMHRLKQEVMNT